MQKKKCKKWQKTWSKIVKTRQKLAKFSVWVTRPERPKGAKDMSRGPNGLQLEGRAARICLCPEWGNFEEFALDIDSPSFTQILFLLQRAV